MSYLYVKNGGTATGDGGLYASEKTGTWANEFTNTALYYDDIDAALDATSLAAGDTISVSDQHNKSQSGVVNHGGVNSDTPIIIQSVDDTSVNTLKAGAQETNTSDFRWSTAGAKFFLYGLRFEIVCIALA